MFNTFKPCWDDVRVGDSRSRVRIFLCKGRKSEKVPNDLSEVLCDLHERVGGLRDDFGTHTECDALY
jgi:hypothetical protein